MPINVIFFGIVAIIIGAFFLFHGYRSFKLKRLIENIPTSKIRSLAMGLVEIFGKVVSAEKHLLKSPFENKPCVFYRYTIEEFRRGKDRNHWATIRRGFESVHFYLQDDSGSVLVDPAGAHVDIPVDFQFTTGMGRGPPPHVREFLQSKRVRHQGMLGFKKKLRFTEYILEPKDKVYILGTAGNNPFVKTAKKNEENIMVQKGVNEKIFYISDKEEGAVLKSLTWKSLGFLLGGAVLSVFGLTVILISFGLF